MENTSISKVILPKALILCGGIFSGAVSRSCTDKSQASATPKGLKAIPVVLNIATLNSDVRLPCHYCDETVGINGRIWRRRDLEGKEKEVELDMHDDDTKNRVFVDKNHNLIIRDITEEDGAYYFCYDVGNTTGSRAVKMDILLDELPVDLDKEVPKLMKACESIKNYVATATEMTAYKKSSFLKKVKVKSLKAMKGVKQAITAVEKKEYEGASLAFFCPGASLDTRVKWKFQNKALSANKIKEKTSGRISIDATDTLHIKELRVVDAGEYICSLYEVEVGLVRLKVISKFTVFDPTSNFGILTIAILLSFVLWTVLMVVKWKSFKLQREVQKRTEVRQIETNADEQEALLTDNLEEIL